MVNSARTENFERGGNSIPGITGKWTEILAMYPQHHFFKDFVVIPGEKSQVIPPPSESMQIYVLRPGHIAHDNDTKNVVRLLNVSGHTATIRSCYNMFCIVIVFLILGTSPSGIFEGNWRILRDKGD